MGYFGGMPGEEVVKWRLQEGKDGYVPSLKSDRRENTGVLEDTYSIYVGSNHVRYILGGQKK